MALNLLSHIITNKCKITDIWVIFSSYTSRLYFNDVDSASDLHARDGMSTPIDAKEEGLITQPTLASQRYI